MKETIEPKTGRHNGTLTGSPTHDLLIEDHVDVKMELLDPILDRLAVLSAKANDISEYMDQVDEGLDSDLSNDLYSELLILRSDLQNLINGELFVVRAETVRNLFKSNPDLSKKRKIGTKKVESTKEVPLN